MEIIETIFLRTLNHELIEQALNTLNPLRAPKMHSGLTSIRVLRNASIDTDLAVFLFWNKKENIKGKSDLGHYLSDVFSDFGIINHSIWKNNCQ